MTDWLELPAIKIKQAGQEIFAFGVDGKLFWGLDGLPMLRAYLDGDAWFDGPDWNAVSQLPSGLPGKP